MAITLETTVLATPNLVRQGETFDFSYTVNDGDTLTGTYEVKQYPDDTATLSGSLTVSGSKLSATLSTANTASLAVGQWFVYATISDSDDTIKPRMKIYVTE